MSKKEHLSRGLQSLLGGVIGIESDAGQEAIVRLNPLDIQPNSLQPRDVFDDKELNGLMASIQKHGVLQPVLVKPLQHGYMLIAGERRWRAAKQLGLKEIPAIVRQVDDTISLEIALVENIQRESLNPMEKAKGFQELMSKFKLTHEEIARAMGKERSSITNYMRLLDLPEAIQEHVSRGTLSMGHARSILAIKDKSMQVRLCERIVKEGLSVREVETIASTEKDLAGGRKPPPKKASTPHIADLEDRFRRFFGAKVAIKEKNGKGRITIAFHNHEEFKRIATNLGITL